MKKNIGKTLALYPVPAIVVGAMNGDKPTWTLAAHAGIIGHDRIMLSLVENHFITGFIKKNGKFSINIVDEEILPQADYAGSVSGEKEDKSELFAYDLSEDNIPMIINSPVSIELNVEDIHKTPGFNSFICTIDGVYADEKYLNEKGKIDYNILKPILFEFPTYEYIKTGEVLGKCLSFKEPGKNR